MLKKVWNYARTATIAVLAGVGVSALAWAQVFVLANGIISGHYSVAGNPPVGVGCTLVSGSTDTDGACTTSATSGSLTFAVPYLLAPSCTITDLTANAATNAFTISATAITLGTVTSAHLLNWHCAGKIGG